MENSNISANHVPAYSQPAIAATLTISQQVLLYPLPLGVTDRILGPIERPALSFMVARHYPVDLPTRAGGVPLKLQLQHIVEPTDYEIELPIS